MFATVSAWIANPADVVLLSKLKQGTGSNVPLLGADPATPTGPVIQGRPICSSPSVPVGTVWGLATQHTMIVLREGTTIETDDSVFFTSDRVAIRARLRVAFGFPHPAAVVKITRATTP